MNLTALNGSSVLECFERSNATEIRNGKMFDFYPGLSHNIHFLIYGIGRLASTPLPWVKWHSGKGDELVFRTSVNTIVVLDYVSYPDTFIQDVAFKCKKNTIGITIMVLT